MKDPAKCKERNESKADELKEVCNADNLGDAEAIEECEGRVDNWLLE